MDKKFHRKKKNASKHIENLEKLRDEDEFVSIHFDPDGKIIFINENITPDWMISKLNGHFSLERNEGAKCRGLIV